MHGRIRIIDELKEPLSEIPDQVARSLYIRYLSERVGVEEDALLQRVKAVRSERGRRLKSRGKAEEPDAACKDGLAEFADNRIERRIIAMMLQFPEIVPDLENRGIIDYFEEERLRELAALILSHPPASAADMPGLLNQVEDEDRRQLLASLAIGEECWDRDSCEKLVAQFLAARRRRQNELLEQIKAAEAENDQERLFALLKEKQKQMAKSG
jgi:DNA primase